MRERWVRLDEFPTYAVSDFGRVANVRRDMLLTPTQNAQGISKIGLVKNGRTTSRSVALLVAEAFVLKPVAFFNSPINLDGDRMNCHALNLLWRPRWYAVQYHGQFDRAEFHNSKVPIENLTEKEQFLGWRDPSIKYGLRYIDIILSCANGVSTPITSQRYRWLD